MKNVVYTVFGISMLVMGLMAVSWAQNSPLPNNKPPVVGTAPVLQPQAAAPVAPAPAPAAEMTKEETVADLKKNLEDSYTAKLPFKVTEDKILAFVRTAIRVEKINSKWDVQIAAAETDQMAIEYNNFAVEEVNGAMKNLEGVTFEEYQALTKLTVEDPNFNKIYQAYKQLALEGYFGPLPSAKTPPAATTAKSATAGATAVKPPAAAANPGTAPAPQGSPKPPYSPPAAR